jgi:hypothetical protein
MNDYPIAYENQENKIGMRIMMLSVMNQESHLCYLYLGKLP